MCLNSISSRVPWSMAVMLCCCWLTTGCGQPSSDTASQNEIGDDGQSTEEAALDGTDEVSTSDSVAAIQEEPEKIVLGETDLLSGIPGEGALSVEEVEAWLADDRNHEPLEFDLPPGLSEGAQQIKGVDENPLTRAKIELGRQLFFDTRLSADNTISCASCHHPEDSYSRKTRFGVGIDGQEGNRNSPVSFNRILSDLQFWDGRAATLEEQAVGPIANPSEMGNTHEAVVQTLTDIDGYRLQFEKIFGQLTIDEVGQALASFERAIVTGPSPYDYQKALDAFGDADPQELQEDDPELYELYVRTKANAGQHSMSEGALRGMRLFFSDKSSCSACHVGANLTDEKYYNLGIGMDAEEPDLGRFVVTGDEKDRGAFKTPTIRNVFETAPYMHDGSVNSLDEVVEWYDKGGHPNPQLNQRIKKLNLTPTEKSDLVDFMKACSGDLPLVEQGRLPG